MSQVFLGTSSSPAVPTSFATDVGGPAVPAANIITISGTDSTVYNVNGISSEGSGSTVSVVFNNRVQGTTTTVGAVTGDIITFDCGATPGVFKLRILVACFDSATPSGAGYVVQASVRTTGAAATLIDYDLSPQEEAALNGADITGVISGNDLILRVLGVAGLTINWSASGKFERAI